MYISFYSNITSRSFSYNNFFVQYSVTFINRIFVHFLKNYIQLIARIFYGKLWNYIIVNYFSLSNYNCKLNISD